MSDVLFMWLEATRFSTWIREDPSIFAFPSILTAHAIGMALVVGVGVALNLRILGGARGVPLIEMKRFFPAMWTGLWLNVVSGILLLIAYPTKALTNPLFYLKLTLIAIALRILRSVRRQVFGVTVPHSDPMPARLKTMAALSLVCWAAAITSGRLLAYTYKRLMAAG
jgi:hypothetical protein